MAGYNDMDKAAAAALDPAGGLPPGIANLDAGLNAFTLGGATDVASGGGFHGFPPAAFGGAGGLPPGMAMAPRMDVGAAGSLHGFQHAGGNIFGNPFGGAAGAGGDVGAQLTALFSVGGIPTGLPAMPAMPPGFQAMPGFQPFPGSLAPVQPGLFNPGTSVFAPPPGLGLGAAAAAASLVGGGDRIIPGKLGDLHPGQPPLSCAVMYMNPGITATLTSSTWNRLTVCHNEGSHFWAHEDVQSGNLAQMEIAMGSYYAPDVATVPAGFEFAPGMLYAAPFMSENEEGLEEVTWTRVWPHRLLALA